MSRVICLTVHHVATPRVLSCLNPLSPQSSKSASVLFPIVNDTGCGVVFPLVLNCVLQGQSITSDPICGTFSQIMTAQHQCNCQL